MPYKGVVSSYENGKAKVYIEDKGFVTYKIDVCEHCRPLYVGDTVIISTLHEGFAEAVVIGVVERIGRI